MQVFFVRGSPKDRERKVFCLYYKIVFTNKIYFLFTLMIICLLYWKILQTLMQCFYLKAGWLSALTFYKHIVNFFGIDVLFYVYLMDRTNERILPESKLLLR
eukprot:TRINITY_DN332_c0_g1_i5.p6 TRINITY_DN332_c0_g1~~TRINITY_DN332_c0_g1_i5.p6  ORF type:complete len:102 (+),score=0.55 TRINITY_DN332_c0_g1_i5:539-844(+)